MHACAVRHMHQAVCYAWVPARKEACTYLCGMHGGWHPTPRSSHVQAETHLKASSTATHGEWRPPKRAATSSGPPCVKYCSPQRNPRHAVTAATYTRVPQHKETTIQQEQATRPAAGITPSTSEEALSNQMVAASDM